jgi:drug/metabolite transporter (DMT)-like permease
MTTARTRENQGSSQAPRTVPWMGRPRAVPSRAPRRGTRRSAGLGLAALSAATFGTSGTFGSSLLTDGWSPGAAVLARIGVAALILTGPALVQLRGRWGEFRRSARLVAGYGLIGVAGCQVCYFNAIERMPVGIALLLEYLGAVLVVGWLWLRHGQRPRALTVVGAAVAVAGLALMVGASGAGGLSPVGVLWGMLAAVSMAVYFFLSAGPVAENGSAGPVAENGPAPAETGAPVSASLPPVVLAWAGMCVGTAILALLGIVHALPLTASASDVTLLGHRVSWVLPVMGIALLAAVIAYSTGIAAIRRLGPKLASFIGMTEVLFASLFAWMLLGQLPSATQFLGGALIFVGVILVRVDES